MNLDYFTFVVVWEVFPFFAKSPAAYSLNALSTSHQTELVRSSGDFLFDTFMFKNII